ncbi:hypothetical protein FB45DRAFT_832425 [Roridomyces roridus]|uniref:Sacsin/Nov domain-containing protein n=1 Tax=Roridomyces roridus TaxID=1738132 RepID=A0AAD7BXH5_9AGAR|nr:hypothetical protein FB45DRAFT_832425 [Roridomyces roridus]
MPRNFSEHTDLTKIIKSILDSYPLGNGILRELLQNSDDASATTQTFILDLRTHPSTSVVDPELSGSQGPALLAVNDTLFSDEDWKGISTLHGSSKTTDETKIGKFGIGARACYHLTDNPHFLSGDKLVIFDPHERFSGDRLGGVMIDIPEEGRLYPDQFAAFGASFSPDAVGIFSGTIVRLPLRTTAQAPKSTIKPTVVEADMIDTLFHEFVEKELSVVMLFLKHIRYICLKVIEPNGRERFVGSAEIPDLSIADRRVFSRNKGAREESFRCNIDFTSVGCKVSQAWRIFHSVRSTDETARIMTNELGYPIGSKLADDKLFSHVALAFPIGGPTSTEFKGRLFTLLPLPIHTGFPVHMHGILALTQDRQSLRNIEELGTGIECRERLLVTWNRSIFDKFLPAAWCRLLRVLVQKNEVGDIWAAWPSSHHAATNGAAYWIQILPNLLKEAIESNLAIFPAINPLTGPRRHVQLSSAIIAAQDEDPTLLSALATVGLTIVQLPGYIQKSLPVESRHLVLQHNSPRLREALLGRIPELQTADDACKLRILKYLAVSPGKITNATGLPLVPLVNGSWLSLSSPNSSETGAHVLVSREEEAVFKGCDECLISLSKMPADVVQVFCSPETAQTVNVVRLDKTIVWRYLNDIFGRLNPAEDEITGKDAGAKVEWLIRFWKWVHTRADKDGLLGLVKQFHLLPTAQGTLRKMESRVVLPIPEGLNGSRTMTAWATLGVRFLHPDLAPYSSAFCDFAATHTDVSFLIRSISPDRVSGLQKASALLIQSHLIQSLRSATGKAVRVDDENRQTFLSLPIFPTRVPRSKSNGTKRSERVIGPASGSLIYTSVDDACPVPIVPGTTFFDASQTSPSRILATIFDAAGVKKSLDELGVLEMSITHLAAQSLPCLDMLLDRIIPRLADLSPNAKNNLQDVPFVSVVGSSKRMPPMQVVDPRSELAPLYHGEPGKLPSGQWAGESRLNQLSSHGFLLRNLTAEIAEERISYLSGTWGPDDHPRIFEKAKLFLRLLDKAWSPSFDALSLAKNWLPIRPKMPLATPAGSRDSVGTAYLFDLVLHPVNGRVENETLRMSLGWDCVTTRILQDQFSCALTHLKNRGLRLHALIAEFSSRPLSGEEINSLKATAGNLPWIPVGKDEIIQTEHALLERSNLLNYGRFRFTPQSLQDAPSKGKGAVFLQRMGCTTSPSLETLLTELKTIIRKPADRSVSETLDILKAMAPMLGGCSPEDLERIYVPGTDAVLHPKDEIYFLDNTATDFRPATGFCAHPDVSPSLARALGLQFLSSLELGDDDDDDDDLQMGEDLTNRVQNILKEHDVHYALNEFLANAVDAKAKEFSVVLDERTFESSKVLGPGLAQLQQRPSLFLYNDAKLSDDDFRGLRKVGHGGKRSNPDSIGRYGLGALSLFHFTDVVQVVSCDRILILDPSGTHLPPRKGRTRTSVSRRLSEVSRNFPDQLSAFDSIHGFSKSGSFYSGTLFRLCLRNSGQPSILSSKCLQVSDCAKLLSGSYFDLAKDATFFTGLEKISATHSSPMGQQTSIWSVETSRTAPQDAVEVIMSFKATHPDGTTNEQRWLITKSTTPISSVPSEHAKVLQDMGLHQSKIGLVARTALMLKDSTVGKEASTALQPKAPRYLFSTMRLPVQTSLPAHISAQFAILSDRRNIRFEPPDASGRRPPEAAFNKWILDNVISPLYISSINFAAKSSRTVRNPFRWWPVNHGTDDASISREIVETFYALAAKTAIPICYTVTLELIAPIDAVFPANDTPYDVKEVLRELKIGNFVQPPHDVRQLLIKAAAVDSRIQFLGPSSVRKILLKQSFKLPALYNKPTGLGISLFDSMLSYLLAGSESAANLPLIVLADGSLTFANLNGPTRYICSGELPDLFNLKHFLHPKFSERTQKLLVQSPDLNIKYFDSDGALALIRDRVPPQSRCVHSAELQQWIASFWETYHSLPGLPSLASLDSLPLIPIVGGEHVSLEYCLAHDEVMTETVQHPTLVSAMQKMERSTSRRI